MWLFSRLLWGSPAVEQGGTEIQGEEGNSSSVMHVGTTEADDARGNDEFDAQDLLRHLQENEGYEVYEFFEAARGRKGSRVLAPRRLWVEALEVASPTAAASS